MRTGDDLRRLSLWWDTLPDDLRHADRPPLDGDAEADVAIVGAGYTGLWTAYYLTERDPSLRIVVVEAEVAGFGASGRNGGWCSSFFPASMARLAEASSPAAARAMHRAMRGAVEEVGRVARAEGIDCDWAAGGCLRLARTPLQLDHAAAEVAEWQRWGGDDYSLLTREEALGEFRASQVLGGTRTTSVAAINPARLVRGLALAVERRGVTIHERTRATSVEPGVVRTQRGSLRARTVVRAVEGFTPQLPGHSRTLVPVYSHMLATEPLPDDFWSAVGLADRQVFGDHRHTVIYGQRTADGRIAFGGRGAQYRWGSRVHPSQDRDVRIHADIWRRLTDLVPEVTDFAVTHTWGGPLGVPRDWCASVGLDPATGLAWSGGYVGDGVGTSNLGGRTLADLISGTDSELTGLPWVNHRSPRWEPEPLRWTGVRAGNAAMLWADDRERRTGRDSIPARVFGRLIGH